MSGLVVYSVDIARKEFSVAFGLPVLNEWTRGMTPQCPNDLVALCHRDDLVHHERRVLDAIAARSSFACELRLSAELGERWLQVTGAVLDNPTLRVVGSILDITERRRQEATIGSNESKLETLLRVALDGIITIDEQGDVVSLNGAAAVMFRSTAQRMIGVPVRTFLDLRFESLATESPPCETCGRRADGSVFAAEYSAIRVVRGTTWLTMCMIRDVSEGRSSELRVFDAKEELRRRIGQDLHDGLGQLLTGTAFLAKGLESNVAAEYQPQALRVTELLNQAITFVRGLAHGLSVPQSGADRLEVLLGHIAAESSKMFAVDCTLELRGFVDVHMPSGAITELGAITREAITNAVRHGRARRIAIALGRDGPCSYLSVEDDGIGIENTDEPKQGLGLRSMRRRALSVGGALEIERLARGTAVRCWWRD